MTGVGWGFGRAAGMSQPPTVNKAAASRIAAGRVVTQTRPIFWIVSP